MNRAIRTDLAIELREDIKDRGKIDGIEIETRISQEKIKTTIIHVNDQTGEELGWRGFMREEFNRKYGFLKSSVYQGLVWCFWHTLLWIVDSEFTDWRAIPYIISNIVVITSITVLMNIFLERHNNLLYSVSLHFGFNIIYVFLDADIGFFIILTVLYLIITPIAVLIKNKFIKNN